MFQGLTADIGKILELDEVDKGLDDYRSTSYLTFEQYRYYMFKEVSGDNVDTYHLRPQSRT